MRFYDSYSDLELISALRQGYKEAGDEIIDRYYPKVLSVCCQFLRSQVDGHDAAQEVFFKAIVEKKVFRFRAQSKLLTWLISISLNVCKSHLRKKRRSLEMTCFEPEGITVLETTTPSQAANPEQEYFRTETRRGIFRAIEKLPPKCRKAIYCIYIKEKSYREAAQDLKIPVNILGVRLMYGRKLMLRLFKKEMTKEKQVLPTRGYSDPGWVYN